MDVKGHSKSVGYEPGMRIAEGKFTNTWNGVLIDGEWRFVQCNWGARSMLLLFFIILLLINFSFF